MPIMVTCSHCQAKAMVREEFAGRSVKCPKCGQIFQATASANPAAPPAVAAPPPMPPEPPRVFPAPPASPPPAPPLSAPAPPPSFPVPPPSPPSAAGMAPAPLVVTCTHCQTKAKIAAEFAGRHVKCPSCQQVYVAAGEPLPAEPPLARVVDNAPDMRDRYSPDSRRDEWDRRPLRDAPREVDYPPRRSRYDDDYAPRGRYDDDEDDFREPRDLDRLPRKLPGGDWTLVAAFLLAGVVLLDLVGIGVQYAQMRRWPDDRSQPWEVMVTLVRFVLGVLFIVFFCIWMHRAYSNLRLFRAKGVAFTPGLAVGCWFIPFLFFVWPFMALQELWKASDPRASPRNWRDSSVSGLVIVYWLTGCLSILLSVVAAFMVGAGVGRVIANPGNPNLGRAMEQFRTAAYISMVASALWILTGVMLIVLLLMFRNRQVEKWQILLADSGTMDDGRPRDRDDVGRGFA